MLTTDEIHEIAEVEADRWRNTDGHYGVVDAIESGIRAALVANDREANAQIQNLRAERVDDASEHAEEVASLKQQLDAAHEVHRLDIQTQAEMVTKLEQVQPAFTLMPLYEKLVDEIRRIEAWTNPGVSDILFAITKAKGETK